MTDAVRQVLREEVAIDTFTMAMYLVRAMTGQLPDHNKVLDSLASVVDGSLSLFDSAEKELEIVEREDGPLSAVDRATFMARFKRRGRMDDSNRESAILVLRALTRDSV